MSIYGNVSDRSRTDLKFDKIYPNRFMMEKKCSEDDIFVGRYVLVNYEGGYNEGIINVDDNEYTAINIDGKYFIYKDFDIKTDITGITSLEKSVEVSGDKAFKIKKHKSFFNFNPEEKYIKVTKENNKLIFEEYIDNIDEYNAFWEGQEVSAGPEVIIQDGEVIVVKNEETLVNLNSPIYLKVEKNCIYETNREDEIIIGIEAESEDLKKEDGSPSVYYKYYYSGKCSEDDVENLYNVNFNIDENIYKTKRGYDSTVWEKIYQDDEYKYVKIADLNSVTPSFSLDLNAPTPVPKTPVIAPDGDNLNYKINWQPSWGFRIKSAKTYQIPQRDENGNNIIGENNEVLTMPCSDAEGFNKSDAITYWTTQIYDEGQKVYKKKYFNADDKDWTDKITKSGNAFPAAIYFNKSGFNLESSCYSNSSMSTPKEYFNKDYIKGNYIKVEPTGYSGTIYTENGEKIVAPDTQELSIMLPILGDSVALLWDTIYGKDRKTDIEWKDGTEYLYNDSRDGLRMAPGSKDLDYKPGDLKTLAGCINTVHDLIGMIVIEKDELNGNMSEYEQNFIYYDKSTKKYYQKQYLKDIEEIVLQDGETYESKLYEKINTNNLKEFTEDTNKVENTEHEKYYYKEDSGLKDSEDKTIYNYILKPTLQTDREYCTFTATKKENLATNFGKKYEDNKYYFKPDGSLNTWQKSVLSDGFEYVEDREYYEIPFEDCYNDSKNKEHIDKAHSFYVPNYYYYQWPIYDENKERDGEIYILDTSEEGFSYPEYMPEYETEWKDDNSGGIPTDYIDNFYNQPVKYYLPTPVLGEDDKPLMQGVKTTYKYLIDKEKDFILDNNGNIIGPRKQYYKKNGNSYESINVNDICGCNKKISDLDYDIYVDKTEITVKEVLQFDSSKYYLFEYKYGTNQIYYTQKNSEKKYRYFPIENIDNAIEKISDNSIESFYYVKNIPNSIPVYVNDTKAYIISTANKNKGSYLIENIDIESGNTYYDITDETLVNFFKEDSYYKKDESGTYQKISSYDEVSTAGDYIYKKNSLVVFKDSKNIFKSGTIWNSNVTVPSEITLGQTIERPTMVELEGFARNINTILGLIVKINNLIKDNDEYSRDRDSIQGTLNYLNDIINRIDDLYAGELVFTDQFGRVYNSKESVKSNDWIELTLNKNDSGNPTSLEAIHKNAKIVNEIVDAEITLESLGDTGGEVNQSISFTVPEAQIDEKGHVYGFKNITYIIPLKELMSEAYQNLVDKVNELEKRALSFYDYGVNKADSETNTFRVEKETETSSEGGTE